LPTTSALRPRLEALALHTAHETRTVELVADEAAVLTHEDGVGGARDRGGRGQLVDQLGGHHLVRHRDGPAANVRHLEQQREGLPVLLGLHTHRHDDGVDALLSNHGL
jgi:hypothetical protein